MIKKMIGALMLASAFASCTKDNEYDLSQNSNNTCDTTAVSYANTVANIMANNCNSCHSGSNPSGGVVTSTYVGLGNIYDAVLLGVINHSSGFSPMPSNAPKLSDCDINKIQAWINQGRLNN
jgi:mono/diheme cytochrome c family protein